VAITLKRAMLTHNQERNGNLIEGSSHKVRKL
jgi:hypothetical protein